MGLYIILIGVQGAGKGVQAQFITRDYGIPQISTGDLFRAMKTRTDALAQEIQRIMAEGKLISDDITNRVVEERLQQPDVAHGAIFDGYPRTPDQAAWLEQHLAKKGEKIGAVLYMKLDFYDAFRRAFGRVRAASGDAFNVYSQAEAIEWKWVDHPEKAHPPRLEAWLKGSNEKLERRPDDASADAIIKRIDIFRATTAPLLDYYRAKGLVHEVDAAASIEAVTDQIKSILDTLR